MNSVNIIIVYYDGHNFNCTDTYHHRPSHTITITTSDYQLKYKANQTNICVQCSGAQGVVTPTNNEPTGVLELFFYCLRTVVVVGLRQGQSIAIIRLEINPAGD